jgi:hypothetical protein
MGGQGGARKRSNRPAAPDFRPVTPRDAGWQKNRNGKAAGARTIFPSPPQRRASRADLHSWNLFL